VSNELQRAQEQLAAGDLKKAASTLWDVERLARTDLDEARGLLEVASELRDKASGRVRGDCDLLIDDAQRYIDRALQSPPRLQLGMARYLGSCQAFGAPRSGNLSLADDAVFFDATKLEMALIASVEVGGGQVAKSRVAATLVFGVAGLGSKATEDRAEMAIHLASGEAAFFQIEATSPFELRAKVLPLLRGAGIPLVDTRATEAGAPAGAADAGSTLGLADELAKLARLHESGFLTDAELAAAKAKLLS